MYTRSFGHQDDKKLGLFVKNFLKQKIFFNISQREITGITGPSADPPLEKTGIATMQSILISSLFSKTTLVIQPHWIYKQQSTL